MKCLLVLAVVAIGGACGSDDTPGAAGDTVASTTIAESAPVTEVPASDPMPTEPRPSEPPSTEPETSPPPADGCPVGTWLISTEELQGFYDVVNAAAGTNLTFVGEVRFTLRADGSFSYDMTDFVLTLEIGGMVTAVSLIGSVTGTYTIVDGKFVTTIVDPDVTATVVSNGVEVDGTGHLEQFLAEFPVNNASFTCDGADLVVDFATLDTTASVRMVSA